MDGQHLFDIILGIVVSVMGFFAKNTHMKIEKTAEDLAAHRIHSAESYAKKEDVKEMKEEILNAIYKLDGKLDGKADKK